MTAVCVIWTHYLINRAAINHTKVSVRGCAGKHMLSNFNQKMIEFHFTLRSLQPSLNILFADNR